MAYAGVLVVAAINCVVLYFAALLAAGGDGNFDGVRAVWLFGYTWIALVAIAALITCRRKTGAVGIVVAASALPTAYVGGAAAVVIGAGMNYFKPSSPEFMSACKTSGVWFLAPPAEPVQSLAYEWGSKYSVDLNYFRIDADNRVSEFGTRNLTYPPGLTLVQNKLTRADVLVRVSYPIGKEQLWKTSSRQGLVGYEMTVLDQRDSRTLASLRYFTDLSNGRACGPTVDGTLSISAFVLEAIGAQ